MGDNSFHTTVESLFKGMDSFITTKTVVGDAIHIGDTIILPLVDVSFGVAAGAFSQEKKNNGAGGMGGKITPSAVLVIQNGTTKLVNIKNQDGLTKVLDMVPDFVNKFTSKGGKENVVEESEDDSAAKKTAAKEMEQILSDSVNKEEDYYLNQLRIEINENIEEKNYIKAKEKINLYRQHMPAEGKVHEQFCCYMECRILIAQNEITEKLSALLLRAIRYTIPDYLLENCVSRRLYSPVEIELIRMHITYNDRKCECNEVELFLIMDFVTEFYSLKQQEKIEIPLLVDCVKYEIALEKYNRALASIERALDIISVGRSMQYVGELHFLKAQVLSCVQNSIDKNREWQDECKRECFMAYVVFGVMGKKEEKEEIYKYCLEKLNWQITEQMMLSD